MIDRPVKIGCTELYTARVLNMSVAQYYGVFKEYAELLNKARQRNSRKLKIHHKTWFLPNSFAFDET